MVLPVGRLVGAPVFPLTGMSFLWRDIFVKRGYREQLKIIPKSFCRPLLDPTFKLPALKDAKIQGNKNVVGWWFAAVCCFDVFFK